MRESRADTLITLLSVALAAGVIAFASYKVGRLAGMENPPANLGLSFPAAPRKVIMDEGALLGETMMVDPITTQSTDAAEGEPPVPRGRFALLAVVDGVAFVAVNEAGGRRLVPVTRGMELPGGFRVQAIEQRRGRWTLVAGALTLSEVQ